MTVDRDQTRRKNRVEIQTWGNVPPYPSHTMYRAKCKCGASGQWFHYRENAERERLVCGH